MERLIVPELFWTKKPPTEEGWYWHRADISWHGRILYLSETGFIRLPITLEIDTPGNIGGEWWGPIPEPGGDAVENCEEVTSGQHRP